MPAKIQIVDENDAPIGEESIQIVRDKGLWHRYIRLMVTDGSGNYLLQLRGPQNRMFPHCWDFSVAGHVDGAEPYEEAAKRECTEELGISGMPITETAYFKSQDIYAGQKINRYNKTFEVVAEKDLLLAIDTAEVLEAKWHSTSEVEALIRDKPETVTPELVRYFQDT